MTEDILNIREKEREEKSELIINSRKEERKKEEESLIINYNKQQIITNSYIHKSLAIHNTPSNQQLLQDLTVIWKRDGWSFNRGTLEALREYHTRHPVPNPQGTLTRHFDTGLPLKPAWQCCVGNCRGKARYHLILKNFKNLREHTIFLILKERD